MQTYTPFHPAIQAARRLDFEGFCDQEIEFRRELSYPPFTHLVCIDAPGARPRQKVSFCAAAAGRAACARRFRAGTFVAEPAPAPLARAKGLYRYQVMLRCRRAGRDAAVERS